MTKRIRNKKTRAVKKNTGGDKKQRFLIGLKVAFALLGLIGLSLSFIFIHDAVTQCDFFKSKRIHIAGAKRLTEQQVLAQAGIALNDNILAVNLTIVRKRLLRHPWIAEAQVARELPDTIAIRIWEHDPLAVLDLGGKFLINSRGEVFKVWSSLDPDNLPLVTGLVFSDIRLDGDKGSSAFNALMTALHLGREKDCILPNHEIRQVHVDPDLGLTLYAFDERKVVKLGYRHFEKKFRRLEILLYQFDQHPGWTGFDAIDLANLNRVVVNPTRGETPAGEFKEGFGAGT